MHPHACDPKVEWMAIKFYRVFCGTECFDVEAASLADARTVALVQIAERFPPGLVPPVADEIRVRPVRDDELATAGSHPGSGRSHGRPGR